MKKINILREKLELIQAEPLSDQSYLGIFYPAFSYQQKIISDITLQKKLGINLLEYKFKAYLNTDNKIILEFEIDLNKTKINWLNFNLNHKDMILFHNKLQEFCINSTIHSYMKFKNLVSESSITLIKQDNKYGIILSESNLKKELKDNILIQLNYEELQTILETLGNILEKTGLKEDE